MPTWGHILAEIQTEAHNGNPTPFDTVRQKYIQELFNYTNRNTIVYASRWTTGDVSPNLIVINDEDVQGFMQAIYGLKGNSLDLILHTGGGSAEAADAIVSYLRAKFNDIRIIIPQAAMSAGTMLACSANKIVMAKHSFIGPIDPQFILQTSNGVRAVAAHAIIEQFKIAQEDCRVNPANLNSWLPTLSQYGPALLVECQNQIDFGEELVRDWLKCFMFAGDPTSTKPAEIAAYLSNHKNFKTHGKHINIDNARDIGLVIDRLEDNQDFQGKVLSAFHATMLTLQTSAKITTNHNGEAFIKQIRTS